MTVHYMRSGCKVETKFTLQPSGAVHEEITLSVDPTSQLALAVEESPGKVVRELSPRNVAKWLPCPPKRTQR